MWWIWGPLPRIPALSSLSCGPAGSRPPESTTPSPSSPPAWRCHSLRSCLRARHPGLRRGCPGRSSRMVSRGLPWSAVKMTNWSNDRGFILLTLDRRGLTLVTFNSKFCPENLNFLLALIVVGLFGSVTASNWLSSPGQWCWGVQVRRCGVHCTLPGHSLVINNDNRGSFFGFAVIRLWYKYELKYIWCRAQRSLSIANIYNILLINIFPQH